MTIYLPFQWSRRTLRAQCPRRLSPSYGVIVVRVSSKGMQLLWLIGGGHLEPLTALATHAQFCSQL